jgi:hypothetical protein
MTDLELVGFVGVILFAAGIVAVFIAVAIETSL